MHVSQGSSGLAFTYQNACFGGLSILAEERRTAVETLLVSDRNIELLKLYTPQIELCQCSTNRNGHRNSHRG